MSNKYIESFSTFAGLSRGMTCLGALAFFAAAGCSGAASGPGVEETESTSSDLLLDLGAQLWTQNGNVVPVCWNRDGFVSEKTWIRDSVNASWGAVTSLRFTGWQRCPTSGSDRFVKMDIIDSLSGPGGAQTSGYGMALLRSPSEGGSVRFWLAPDHTTNRDLIEYFGIHEFGHVLGFKHEQDSPANYIDGHASHCADMTNEVATNVRQIGPYDRDSVMNYCGGSSLSTGDVLGVQSIYGLSPLASVKSACHAAPPGSGGRVDLATPWNNGNTTSVAVYPTTGSSFNGWYQGLTAGGWDDRSKYAAGQFKGSGGAIAAIWNDNGASSIAVRASTGTGFTLESWATRQGIFRDADQWLPVNFDRNQYTDLAQAWNDNGLVSINIFVSNGSSFASPWRAASRQGGWIEGASWVSGDFNGDGITDLATIWNLDNKNVITIRRGTGYSFELQPSVLNMGGWAPSTKWLAGDFNGDTYTDLAAVWKEGAIAKVAVYASNGTTFTGWTQWDNSGGGWIEDANWVAGDFDGDGKADLATTWNRDPRNPQTVITVRKSTGSSFAPQEWLYPAGGWLPSTRWCAGKFAF